MAGFKVITEALLPGLIAEFYVESRRDDDRKKLREAAGIFAEHHMRYGYVRFKTISELQIADLYVAFLLNLGFGKRELELVSGDMNPHADFLEEWRNSLFDAYLFISPRGPKRNFFPKTSLWIRPKLDALTKRNSTAADFRFTMAMAFVAFGPILSSPPTA